MKISSFLSIILFIYIALIAAFLFYIDMNDIKDVYVCKGSICQWDEENLKNRKMTYMGKEWLPYTDNRQAFQIVPENMSSKGLLKYIKTYSIKADYHIERAGCTEWGRKNEVTPVFGSQYLSYNNAKRDLNLIKSGKDVTIVKYDIALISTFIAIGTILLNFLIFIIQKVKQELDDLNDMCK